MRVQNVQEIIKVLCTKKNFKYCMLKHVGDGSLAGLKWLYLFKKGFNKMAIYICYLSRTLFNIDISLFPRSSIIIENFKYSCRLIKFSVILVCSHNSCSSQPSLVWQQIFD